MRRFYVPPEHIGPRHTILEGNEVRHALNVLRLGKGDSVVIFDGRGKEYTACIADLDNRRVTLDIIEALPGCPESPLQLTLAQGYLKDKKMDRLVPQLTELGVSRWIPFLASRSVAQPDARRQSQRRKRWEKLSLEALKQCGRSRPMIIDDVVPFNEMLDRSRAFHHKWLFYEKERHNADWTGLQVATPAEVFVIIGPEGGFEPREIDAAEAAGFRILGLGPRILRAQTATLAAAAIIQGMFGDIAAR